MKILYKSLIENEIGDYSEIYSINGKKIRFNPTHIDQDGHNPGELIAFSWCTCLQATLKYVLKTKGIADTLLHSSSMDFASEYGFKKDGDAWKLFDAGIELIK